MFKLFSIFQKDNAPISNKDILIIVSNSDPKLSLICQLISSILDTTKHKNKINYKIINLYSYNLPIYKINAKIPKNFVKLTRILNNYSNYVFVFPVWYSNVPGVLKNFIDWSGYWGTKRNSKNKLVGILKGKKSTIIASCWDTRKDYLKKLSSSIEYQIVESVFSFYEIKHLKTLIIPDAHNHNEKNLSLIKSNLDKIVTLIHKNSV